MKRLNFTKICNPNVLHDELKESFPDMELLETLGGELWVTVSDDTNEAAVAEVIDAHSLETKQRLSPELEAELALRASALVKLQDVSGLTGPELDALFRF